MGSPSWFHLNTLSGGFWVWFLCGGFWCGFLFLWFCVRGLISTHIVEAGVFVSIIMHVCVCVRVR